MPALAAVHSHTHYTLLGKPSRLTVARVGPSQTRESSHGPGTSLDASGERRMLAHSDTVHPRAKWASEPGRARRIHTGPGAAGGLPSIANRGTAGEGVATWPDAR